MASTGSPTAPPAPARASTLSTMAWLTWNWLVRGSGSASRSRSKVESVQFTAPAGAFLRTTFLSFFGSSPALASSLRFSMTCSGAMTSTSPTVSKPARPARPAIWWNSRAVRWRMRSPSYLTSDVMRTVRMGTLMPTPRVSVPQTTLRRPRWVSRSTRRRYLGSIPAWCTPMPARRNLLSVLPKPVPNRNAPISAAMAAFSSLEARLVDSSACARSTASFCVKCTT